MLNSNRCTTNRAFIKSSVCYGYVYREVLQKSLSSSSATGSTNRAQNILSRGCTITIVGTYGYMPPEQFSGKAHPASDLYSLGATLVYLLIRRHPADLPVKRGQMEFEVSDLISDLPSEGLRHRMQNWLRYLVHPSVVQRLMSARWALDTLTDENLPLQSKQGLYAKPHGTRVGLKKTVDREAHWLAYELSYRLRLPVCELAVVSSRNPALRQR